MSAKWLGAAIALQECDLQIRRLRQRLEMLPVERANFAAESKTLAETCTRAKNDLSSKENKLKSLESDAVEQDTKMKKLLTQSTLLRKQEEYNASMSEIERCKTRRSDIETEELVLMDEIEEARKHLEIVTVESKSRQIEIDEETAELDVLEKEIIRSKAEREKERPSLFDGIPPEILSHYERLLARGKGAPLAEIREETCQNCNTSVTLQRINDAKHGEMVVCDCGHLLYIP